MARSRVDPPHKLVVDEGTSRRLAAIRQHGTGPELVVRRLVFRTGHRYRVENRDLPGSPDLANRARHWVIFVHGCFWHAHPGCRRATIPKRNAAFWSKKFQENRSRDERVLRRLSDAGFRTLVVWECELDQTRSLRRRVERFLGRR